MGNIQIARVLGIPIIVNLSWLLTLGFVTTILALRFYPEVIPRNSVYRDDQALHWIMALVSGIVFFASIVVHELAHSLVARRQGLSVKNITLFVFGGVSQIGGEARRPLHEFVMAIIGPISSVVLAGIFFALWWLAGASHDQPVAIVLEWLFLMNLVVAIFNMAPGFPMDGGRVLRSLLWGLSGNLYRATRLATLVGRGMGYGLMLVGGMIFFGTFEFLDPWSGIWLAVLGFFLETSARQSWMQTRALDMLSKYKAADVMAPELPTAVGDERLHLLLERDSRDGGHYIYFIPDGADERVVGVITEKEVEQAGVRGRMTATVSELMLRTADMPVARPEDDGASMIQAMEDASVWHLPVLDDGRVVGVVSKETLMRLVSPAIFGGGRRRRR